MDSTFSRAIFVAAAVALLLAPAAADAGATKEQKEKVKEAMPLYTSPISVPHNASDLAFDRAEEWMAIYPEHRLDVATDTALETLRPTEEDGGSSMDLICSVRRRRTTNDTEFSAKCFVDNPFAAGEGRRASAMLRRYIMTGDSTCLTNGERWDEAALCLLNCTPDGKSCELLPVESSYPDLPREEPMVVGSCTLDQIVTMVQTGLTKEQVKAACGG